MDNRDFFAGPAPEAAPGDLDYLLRRAEQESIAAIRSVDPRIAEPHAHMACVYSAQARSLLTSDDGVGAL